MGPQFPAFLLLLSAIFFSGAASEPSLHLGYWGCQSASDCIGQEDLVQCTPETMCSCIEGYTIASNISACLPIRNSHGDSCEETHQCDVGQLGPRATCNAVNHTCVCEESSSVYHAESGRCYDKVSGFYGSCEIDFQCEAALGSFGACTTQSWSSTKACFCKEGAGPNVYWNRCLPHVRIGGVCEENSQCPSTNYGQSAQCSPSGRCICPQTYVPNSGLDSCLPIVNSLGSTCEEGHQCRLGTPGLLSVCSTNGAGNKVCQCSENAVSEIGHEGCFEMTDTVGGHCDFHSQCLGKLGPSLCIGGMCECLGNSTGVASGNQRCDYAVVETVPEAVEETEE